MVVGGTFAVMLLWACGTAFSLLYLVENRTWLVMFLRKLYRPLSFQAKFRLGSLKVSLSTCLNDFHSGLLSKGPAIAMEGTATTAGRPGGTHTRGNHSGGGGAGYHGVRGRGGLAALRHISRSTEQGSPTPAVSRHHPDSSGSPTSEG